ncbi:MAG: hypothetical protein AB7U29_13710 [Desulfobulbus sp.]
MEQQPSNYKQQIVPITVSIHTPARGMTRNHAPAGGATFFHPGNLLWRVVYTKLNIDNFFAKE